MIAFESRRDRAQLLIVVLGVVIAYAVLPLASGLLGALVLHVAVAPVHRRLASVMPRRIAAVLVVVATALLILLPVGWLVAVAIDTAPDAIRQVTSNPLLGRLSAVR
ncbi:MAG TPA: hypothetical protein VFN38_01490, partial [Gemmatimonadaceae bacterium]|nr:hypothetical protein [Gemmatimonadaceae bacterium]